MFNKFKKLSRRNKILLICGVLAIFAMLYLFSGPKPTNTPSNLSLPPALISPTQAGFELTNIYPKGEQVITFPNTAVAFTFNSVVDDKLISAQIEPTLGYKLYASRDKKTIFVAPLKSWTFDTVYTISLVGLPITAKTTFTPKNPNTSPETFDETFHEN